MHVQRPVTRERRAIASASGIGKGQYRSYGPTVSFSRMKWVGMPVSG